MAEAVAELTIDELARETGMTVRNIRAHQSRGLLPAARGARPHRLLRPRARRPACG
jgi:DNA-binding transcriptional MerR regulator